MGNSVSKKKNSIKQKTSRRLSSSKPSVPRVDISTPDNEHSVNTTQSVSSILITSSQHRKNSLATSGQNTLSQLNPDYPIQREDYNEQDTIGADPFKGKVEHPHQHKLLSQSDLWPPQKNGQMLDVNDTVDSNQLTVSSINDLTMNSINSVSVQDIDDYMKRLLEAGYASKVPKQLCLKSNEVTAICRAAMEIFLSQPVSGEKIFFYFSCIEQHKCSHCWNYLHLSKL